MSGIDFFVPFGWDHVYDDFDRWNETWTTGYEHYKFLWELNQIIPMDGVLISRNTIESSATKKQKIEEAGGVKNFLRIPDELTVFGDCGAYKYRKEDKPPYDPVETLDFYEEMQFDRACTVDHLISGSEDGKQDRWEITLANAEKMLGAYQAGDYSFELYGVVQGWDPDSYHDAASRLVDMGFTNLALGGLIGTRTRDIISILQRTYPVWMDKDIEIHEFGIARWELFPFMQRYGISSFDNAYHRKAWLDRKNNYELSPNQQYTAVRIPISDQHSDERLPEEQAVFDRVREYIAGDATPEDVVETLHRYEEVYAELKGKESRLEIFDDLRDEYLATLHDRPWEDCDCHICEEYGVHVCIFRRNERNMRRGFHNLYRFYSALSGYLDGTVKPPEKMSEYSEEEQREELEPDEFEGDVLVISSCSKTKKDVPESAELPAEEIYQGRLFNQVRDLCDATGWDHRVISAKYGLLSPEDPISVYEETLSTVDDAVNLRPKVIPELAAILQDYDSVLVIGGKQYRKVIEPLFDNRFHILNSAGYPVLCSKIKEATQDTSPTELSQFE